MKLKKIVLHNILTCKKLSMLFFITLIVNSALLYCVLSINNELRNTFINEARTDVGDSDIRIYPGRYSKSVFIDLESLEKKNNYEYVVSFLSATGYYETRDDVFSLSLYGITLNELSALSNFFICEEEDPSDLQGNDIAISEYTKEKYGLNIGSIISVTINNKMYDLHVSKIMNQTGFFANYQDKIIINNETLRKIYSLEEDQVSNFFVKLKDNVNIEEEIKFLKSIYSDYIVEESIQMDTIIAYVNKIMGAIFIVFFLSLIMSIMILFTTFRLIYVKRLPELVTLRCLGLNELDVKRLVLYEGCLYGILGGLIGVGIGVFIFRMIMHYIQPISVNELNSNITFNMKSAILTLFIILFLSVVITFGMTNRMKGLSLKTLLFNGVNEVFPLKTNSIKGKINVIFLLIIIPAFIYCKIENVYLMIILGMAIVILIYKNINIIYSILVKLIVKLIEKVKKGILFISTKNVESNSHVILNVGLIALGVSCIYVLQMTSNNVLNAVVDRYNENKYQIEFNCNNNNSEKINELEKIENIVDIMPSYYVKGVSVDNDYKIQMIQGVNENNFSDFFKFENNDSIEEYLITRKKERNILISSLLSETYNINVGDYLKLEFDEETYLYLVCDIFNTNLYTGNYALASQYNISNDFKQTEYSSLYIKVDAENLSSVKSDIKKKYFGEKISLVDITEEKELNYRSNKNKFIIINLFLVITFVIGIIGIINTIFLSFEGRKKDFSIMLCIGMSQKKLKKLIFFENLNIGLISGVIAAFTCQVFIAIIPSLIEKMGFYITVNFGFEESILCVLCCMIIASLFSFVWISKIKQLQVVNNIKNVD